MVLEVEAEDSGAHSNPRLHSEFKATIFFLTSGLVYSVEAIPDTISKAKNLWLTRLLYTTIILLHGHKTNPNNLVLQVIAQPSSPKLLLTYSRWHITQRLTTVQRAESKRLQRAQSRMVCLFHNGMCLLRRGAERMQEPELVDDSMETVFSRHNKEDARMNSH